MENKFSDELIERIQKYWKKRFSKEILQQDKKVSGDKVTMIMLLAPGHLGFVKLTMNADLQRSLWSACEQLGLMDTVAIS